MKIGRSLVELAQEIERQQEQKRDFLASTAKIELYVKDDAVRMGVGDLDLGIKPIAHQQLATHTAIPKPYYDRMLADDPELLTKNVNTWLHREPQKRLIRTLDNNARAFLSNGYRPLDNSDLLEAALPKLMERGVQIMSCDVTDSRLYLKVVDDGIKKDIPTGRALGDGSHVFFDTLSPALVLSNSEVGLGSLAVQTSIFTKLCTNLAVVSERSTRKYHVGARADIGENVYSLLQDSTKRLTDAALWAQIGDVVSAAFNQAQFDALVESVGKAAEDKIDADPVKVVEVTAKKFTMTEGERGSVLKHLIQSGDLTRYGLHAAITRTAEDLENYDRASQFEQMGGKIIELNKKEWTEITKLAA